MGKTMGAKIDLSGKKFERLKVIKESGRDKFGQVLWKCECKCGKKCLVRGRDLRSGGTKSCGCMDKERATELIKRQTVNHSNPNSIKSKKISKANTSVTRGVSPTKSGKWRATIGYKGKQIYLGEYWDKESAIKARKIAEEKFYKPLFQQNS